MPLNPTVNGGLKYVGNILGDAPGGCITCATLTSDGTPIGIGDPVKFQGTGNALGIPSVIRCAAGDRILGVVEGVLPDTSTLISEGTKFRQASTARLLAVRPADSTSIYEIQDTSTSANLANTSIGLYANLTIANCSTLSGLSTVTVDSASANTPVAQVRILGFVQRSDNTITSGAGKWLVTIGNPELSDSAAGV